MNGTRVRNGAFASGPPPAADVDGPSGRAFIALLEAFRATGGTVPGDIVGRLLEEHQVGNAVGLARLIDTGRVFGFEWRASLWIPMFQFEADELALTAGAQQVRAELPSLWSGWTLAWWFARPNARLYGRSPADMLAPDLHAVMRAARALQQVGEPARPPIRPVHEVAAHV
jgi:hypothetical protein